MFFKRDSKPVGISTGAVYQRQHKANFAEIAEVVWVGTDSVGIPHVRYNLSYRHANHQEEQGSRILAAAIFAERFQAIEPQTNAA